MTTTLCEPHTTDHPEATDAVRELAHRVNDRIHVTLYWHAGDDSVSLAVDDERTGERFELPVERDQALFAFNHPFAYAA
jgi:hypothetical protein